MSQPKKHVLLLSFAHFGHMIPLLELGKKLSKHHRVTFAAAEVRLEDLKSKELFTDDPDYDLHFISTNDGYTKDLDVAGSMEKIVAVVMPALTRFMKAVSNGSLSSTLPPVDIVIADVFVAGPASVCHQHGIALYLFNSASAGLMVRAAMTEDSEGPAIRGFPNLIIALKRAMPFMTGIVVNSFRETEAGVLSMILRFPGMEGVRTYCIGPLFPEEKEQKGVNFAIEKQITDWLSSKDERSVIYVSFGTVGLPARKQLYEIGKALLSLKHPVIFSLRSDHHQFLPKEMQSAAGVDQLPHPTAEYLVSSWIPQKAVLAHPAVGVFVSHCGWNSTLECILSGVPVVAWPLSSDQPGNSEFLVEKGMGRMIKGTATEPPDTVPRLVLADEIQETIADVGGWADCHPGINHFKESARIAAEKAKADIAPNGTSQKELIELILFKPRNN